VKEMEVDFVGFNLQGAGGHFTTLKCPQCGFEYVHMVSVSVQRKLDKTIVSNEYIAIKEEKNPSRGAILTLEYVCENGGHHGELIFQFYKGIIYVEHKLLEPAVGELKDIWRD